MDLANCFKHFFSQPWEGRPLTPVQVSVLVFSNVSLFLPPLRIEQLEKATPSSHVQAFVTIRVGRLRPPLPDQIPFPLPVLRGFALNLLPNVENMRFTRVKTRRFPLPLNPNTRKVSEQCHLAPAQGRSTTGCPPLFFSSAKLPRSLQRQCRFATMPPRIVATADSPPLP